jgi:glycerol-3-phosphate dehydrogenase (NAD(P)+)
VTRVTVVGTTSWGTTLAVLFARNGAAVTLLARSKDEVRQLDTDRENRRHRPGLNFPEGLRVSGGLDVIADANIIVLAVPSAALDANLQHLKEGLASRATVLSATKGVDPASGDRVSELIAKMGVDSDRIVALSGPNFAGEIAAGLPAATVVAGPAAERARQVQSLLNGPGFRVYTTDDIIGVELGGALKNVAAIACGISDGMGYGDNARAALITRALAEITRLGVAAGAQPMTFLGLAGIGDLVLTCSSDQSRNRRLGLALAGGASLETYLESHEGVVEGAITARAVPVLTKRYGVEMPICEGLHAVLYGGKPVAEAARELMARAARPERDEV